MRHHRMNFNQISSASRRAARPALHLIIPKRALWEMPRQNNKKTEEEEENAAALLLARAARKMPLYGHQAAMLLPYLTCLIIP